MDSDAMRITGKDMADYVANFWEHIRERRVLPTVAPGYLHKLLPDAPPDAPEEWKDVLDDVDRCIIPGMTLWQHPHFFAYFPAACNYPSILADMLGGGLACVGFSWAASPACAELEVVMMNWMAGLLGLPDCFVSRDGGRAGGLLQGTASEATIVTMLAARSRALSERGGVAPSPDAGPKKPPTIDKLVCYASEEAHSSVERAALVCHVIIRKLPTDSRHSLRGDTLQAAIESDKRAGLVPFYVCATLGTTDTCAFDNLTEIGQVGQAEGVWVHVDAAYAGAASICPEYRWLLDGVENADSFNFNPHKWMMIVFDCSALWMKDLTVFADGYNVQPVYLKHGHDGSVMDFRNLELPLGRRFRSLKLWFVFRLIGANGLRNNIRRDIALASEFETLVVADPRFEIVGEVTLGLVCFRLKASNAINEELNRLINVVDRRIHLVPAFV